MYDILKNMPEKNLDYKDTTSLKWKSDVIDFFIDKDVSRCLEVGTCWGGTTRILSELFGEVYTIEYDESLINKAKEFCEDCNNIKFICANAYVDDTYKNLPSFNVVVIDCIHEFEAVMMDIQRSLTSFFDENTGLYLVFDDYGHPESTGVKAAVDFSIREGLKIEKYIGEDPGFEVERLNGTKFKLAHQEGIILSYGV
tara:strand:+ start:186 stop:779 length:594 start_codon:yes stop_codon:yes gene_type:complete